MVITKRVPCLGPAQWGAVALAFLGGVGFLVAFVVVEVGDHTLREHGVRTVATVMDRRGGGHDVSYLLDFHEADGRAVATWTGDVRGGTKAGESITVVYDPSDPHHVQETGDLAAGPWADLILAGMGLFFLWLARYVLRMSPDEFHWWLRRRR